MRALEDLGGVLRSPVLRRPIGVRLCVLVLLAVLAAPAWSADPRSGLDASGGPFDLTADHVEYDRVRDVYVARGNVEIRQPGRTLTADWAAFSNATGRGLATGNVVITQGDDVLRADAFQFEAATERGVVVNGILDGGEGRFRLTGRKVRRTGPRTYEFEDGTFTTCRCPEEGRDPWQIEAASADLAIEGYGTARNTRFEILGVPVLWVPWMIYPLKTERSTGFLLPEVGNSSRSGFDVAVPFFWAARPELNVTLAPRFLSKRGFMPTGELEYVIGERSGGELEGSFIRDWEVDPGSPDTPFSDERWHTRWEHEQFLPGDWRVAVDAVRFSDNLVPFDFDDLGDLRRTRYSQSEVFVENRFGALDRLAFTGALAWRDDLQNPDNADRDEFLLQRTPYLGASLAPTPLEFVSRRVIADFDVDYALFTPQERAERVYGDIPSVGRDIFLDVGVDGIPTNREQNAQGVRTGLDEHRDDGITEGDGRYQEGEPLGDRGHRLVMNPRLSVPFRLFDSVEVLPEVGWHGTAYQTHAQGALMRNLVTGRLDVRSTLRRAMTLPFDIGPATHLLEPRFGWALVSSESQRNNPLFVPDTAVPQDRLRQLDLFNVTRDPADRIDSTNQVTLGLGNRFYSAGGGAEPSRLLLDLAVSGLYDVSDDEFGTLVVDGSMRPVGGVTSRVLFGYDLDAANISEGLARLDWGSASGHRIGAEYRYRRTLPLFFERFLTENDRFDEAQNNFERINQASLATRLALTRSWALTYRGSYSFENTFALRNEGGVEYVSKCGCWAVRMLVAEDRTRGVDVTVNYALIGVGNDTFRSFP